NCSQCNMDRFIIHGPGVYGHQVAACCNAQETGAHRGRKMHAPGCRAGAMKRTCNESKTSPGPCYNCWAPMCSKRAEDSSGGREETIRDGYECNLCRRGEMRSMQGRGASVTWNLTVSAQGI